MDKWLRQKATHTKQQKRKQSSQHPKPSGREDKDDTLQQALPTSRIESQQDDQYTKDLERATWLSLRDSSLHHTTLSVKPFGSTHTNTVNKELSVRTKPSPSVQASAPVYETDCDSDWAVDSFLNGVLNQPSSITKPHKCDEPYDPSQEDTASSIPDSDEDETTEDKEEWEVHYNSETDELYEAPSKQIGHDDQAEAGFFGQLRRETWNPDEIRSNHMVAKKRSMTDPIKKNKRIKFSRTYNSSNHNYYATSDDILEGDVEAAGFDESMAGLSWEGVGQTRYA